MTRHLISDSIYRNVFGAVAALILCAPSAWARPIVTETSPGSGVATGIVDVDVGGTLYDVEFLNDTADNLYGGTYDFTNETDASDAVDAVIAALEPAGIDSVGPTDIGSRTTFNVGYADDPGGGVETILGIQADPWANNGMQTTQSDGMLVYAIFTPASIEPLAEVILQVQVFSPDEVLLVATSADAHNTVSAIDSAEGIALLGFFLDTDTSIDSSTPVGLNVFDSAAGATRQNLNQYRVTSQGGLIRDDLNLYSSGSGSFDMFFFDDETAFELGDSMLMDLSDPNLGELPPLGASGNVYAGWVLEDSNIIGRWEVPEPSAALTMVVSLATVAAIARSRRAGSRRPRRPRP